MPVSCIVIFMLVGLKAKSGLGRSAVVGLKMPLLRWRRCAGYGGSLAIGALEEIATGPCAHQAPVAGYVQIL
jgi:hypothetical protein